MLHRGLSFRHCNPPQLWEPLVVNNKSWPHFGEEFPPPQIWSAAQHYKCVMDASCRSQQKWYPNALPIFFQVNQNATFVNCMLSKVTSDVLGVRHKIPLYLWFCKYFIEKVQRNSYHPYTRKFPILYWKSENMSYYTLKTIWAVAWGTIAVCWRWLS